MLNTAAAQAARQTAAKYEAAFERLMAEAESINEQMRRDRVEIERLGSETAALGRDIGLLKAETRTLLTSMGANL